MHVEYKIIGGDGVEYGPATFEEIKTWIGEGRVAGATQVWRSDLQRWSPANRYTELGQDLARLYAVTQRNARPCGFWMRFCAFVMDRAILFVLFFVIWTPIASWQHWSIPQIPESRTDQSVQKFKEQVDNWMVTEGAPVFYPIFFLYEVLLTGRYGASLGKMAIGAQIVLVNGAPLTYNRAALRWVAARISDLTFFVGYLMIAVRPDKRALHDLLAGTKVIYKR